MQLNSKLYTYIRSGFFFLIYFYRKAKPMTLTSLTLHMSYVSNDRSRKQSSQKMKPDVHRTNKDSYVYLTVCSTTLLVFTACICSSRNVLDNVNTKGRVALFPLYWIGDLCLQ